MAPRLEREAWFDDTFTPIPCPLPDERKPGPFSPPPVLEFARRKVSPKHILGYSFSHGRAFNDLDVSVAVANLQKEGKLTEEQCALIDAESIKACRARLGERA